MSFLEVILILLYSVFFGFIIIKTDFFDSPYISKSFLVKIFIFKILVGFLYAYIHFENGWLDTFAFFLSAKKIASLLPENPYLYFDFVFGNIQKPFSQEITTAIGADNIALYGVPRSDFLIRIVALLIPFCYGFYSVTVIFFEFFSLIGIFYVFKFITHFFKYNHTFLKVFLFFSPSLFFWLSGLHKEALTIFGFGVLLYATLQLLDKKWLHLFTLGFGLLFTFYIRDYALLLFIPALIGFLLSVKTKKTFYLPFVLVYFIGLVFFFIGKYIDPKFDFPSLFVLYQQEFINLQGTSNMEMVELRPTIESFATSVPIALFNTIFKPNLSQTHSVWSAIAAIENLIYVLLSLLVLIFSNFKKLYRVQKSVILFFLLFGLTYFLVLGLVVDNVGAIVRYKTIPLIFMGSAFVMLFDFNKFVSFLGLQNKKIVKYVN